MRGNISFSVLLSLLLAGTAAKSQEVVTGLSRNNMLSVRGAEKSTSDTRKGTSLELPFFDDFSRSSTHANSALWEDDYVFINNTFSENQPTKGVATLDALGSEGLLYETLSSTGFRADQLTSRPINLSYPASYNIWLSFWYEAGGLSDMPEEKDSLTLQFYAPAENKWYSVWRTAGNKPVKFVPALVKISNSRYLKDGFRFRFTGYASITASQNDLSMIGNCDIWNLDYIMLDRNRNAADTINADVAFRLPLRSLLKNHEAMPWKQFGQVYLQEMGASIPVTYRNNDTITRNVTRFFEITDMLTGGLSHSFSGGATNVSPLSNISYNAGLVYTYNSPGTDSAIFRVKAILKTDEFDPKGNDTLVFFQKFTNYFAFDDGSAEAGYGINGLGSRNAMLAYRFRSYTKDTLRAIQLSFNDSYQNANKRAFDLVVWADDNGKPGDQLSTVEEVMVENTGGANSFYTYRLPDPVPVSSYFFIGWRQRSETFLNAGFDVNTPNQGRQFYWLNGNWIQSQVRGSVMIRPVVGPRIKITSIDDATGYKKDYLRIWPNPAGDVINIDTGDDILSYDGFITFTDLSGREIMKLPFSSQPDISGLKKGIYVVSVTSKDGKYIRRTKLIKTM